jgi:hypothetical protein
VSAEYGIRGGDEHAASRRLPATADNRTAIRESENGELTRITGPNFLLSADHGD